MPSIGEFARYLGVSVRMLRHYDALGLLVPASVDPSNGYRHYTAAQLDRGNRLIALKDLGFTLEQIGPVLDARLSAAELRAMLLLRRAQVEARIADDRARLARIDRRLRLTEGDTVIRSEFVEKSLPFLRVAQSVAEVGDHQEIGPTIGPMFEHLARTLTTEGVALDRPAVAWYAPEGDRMTIAAAFPVPSATADDALVRAGIEITSLHAVDRAITLLHHGGMDTVSESWQALARHVEDTGLTPDYPAREVYLQMSPDDPASWVTELQQPVR